MKLKIIAAMLLVCILCGIAMLCFGIAGSIQRVKSTQGYKTTEGYLSGCHAELDEDGKVLYRPIYSYQVEGIEYTTEAEFRSEYLPEEGSAKAIKYHPENPAQAVVTGTNRNILLIFLGLFFIFIPTIIGLCAMRSAGLLKNRGAQFLNMGIGFFFTATGAGVLYLQAESFSAKALFSSLGPFIIIPILFILVGILQVVRSVRSIKKRAS